MKYLDEYRHPDLAKKLIEKIHSETQGHWTIMEVCGGQTHTLLRSGVEELLPKGIRLVHGPGCPVCVTPLAQIDLSLEIARQPDVIFCSYGDMLRVPGSQSDLLQIRAAGAYVRMVYSAMDAVKLAEKNPDQVVVFFAVGFETTAPATALAIEQAKIKNISNFQVLVAHVRVPPAMEALLKSDSNQVQGFLAPGHVCTIEGFEEYELLSHKFQVPIVVTGFEPIDLLEGIWLTIRQLELGKFQVQNQYARVVKRQGNLEAKKLVAKIFEPCDRNWRGIGLLPASGLRLRREYAHFDAEQFFSFPLKEEISSNKCRAGEVLQGLLRPNQCPEFAKSCTPDNPLGAPMVSSEGACAAYFRYRGVGKIGLEKIPLGAPGI